MNQYFRPPYCRHQNLVNERHFYEHGPIENVPNDGSGHNESFYLRGYGRPTAVRRPQKRVRFDVSKNVEHLYHPSNRIADTKIIPSHFVPKGILKNNTSLSSYSRFGLNQILNWDVLSFTGTLLMGTALNTMLTLKLLRSLYGAHERSHSRDFCYGEEWLPQRRTHRMRPPSSNI